MTFDLSGLFVKSNEVEVGVKNNLKSMGYDVKKIAQNIFRVR